MSGAAPAAVPPFGQGMNLLNFTGRPMLPMIRQSEAAECGLACLAMVAGYHGHRTTLSHMRRRFPISLRGATLAQLMAMAEEMGLDARPLRGELAELPDLRRPAILHWNLSHFVVLKEVRRTLSGRRYVLHDPARGVLSLTAEEVSRHWTGVALELAPTKDFAPADQQVRLRLSKLGFSLVGLRSVLVQAVALSLLLQLFAFVAPFYLQLAIDKAVPAFDTQFLAALALGFAGLALVGLVTRGVRELILLKLSSAVGFSMVADLFRHLLRLPIGFFERRHTGDVLSRFESTQPITGLMSRGLVSSAIDAVMALATLAMMIVYSPLLACLAVAALALFAGLRVATFRHLRRITVDAIAARAEEASTMIETIRGMATIKLFGRERDRLRLWQNRRADAINADIRLGRMNIAFALASEGLTRLENVLFVYLAVSMVIRGGFTVGMIFAFQAYKSQFLDAGLRFVDMMYQLRLLDSHVDRIADIALEPPEAVRGLAARTGKPPVRGRIELRDVRFAYGRDDPDVLRGVSLTIEPGESIAITGPSGGGKSTLIKLLLGFYQPTAGRILIDGEPMAQFGVDNFRRHVAAVQQDDVLYAGSIADNIAFFDPEIDLDLVFHCAKLACVHDDITALPMGYDSLVGDMGSVLSGGQKQRIFLARALYHRPRILLLDEGTANLDQACEAAVSANLAGLLITRILIAHRPEAINSARRVVHLEDGRLEEVARRPVGLTAGA
ncbi:MAG TPA: peptidase domain-containing ABC transporter [Sphingomonas sp.]|nr:peptidase domain-containing ABC transporter [Sphingomonas sp.]